MADYVEEYTYDAADRVTSVTQHGVTGGNAVAEKRADFTYNDSDQITSIDRYLGTQLVVTSDYTYNSLGQLTSLVHHQGDTILSQYAYTFDNVGLDETMLVDDDTSTDTTTWGLSAPSGQWMLPLSATNTVTSALQASSYANLGAMMSMTSSDGTVAYTYDPTGQLTSATYADSVLPDESYTYDANGNRVTATGATYTTGPDNRLLSDGTFWYTYDPEGNRTSRFIDVNQNWLLDAGDTDVTQYTWDARNRLTSVTDRDTFDGPITQAVDYLYDVEDRWIGKDVDLDADGTIDQMVRFAYNGTQIVLQFDRGLSPLVFPTYRTATSGNPTQWTSSWPMNKSKPFTKAPPAMSSSR